MTEENGGAPDPSFDEKLDAKKLKRQLDVGAVGVVGVVGVVRVDDEPLVELKLFEVWLTKVFFPV